MAAKLSDEYWREGRITEEGVAKMYASIGQKREVPAWNSVVTADTIWHYAWAIGDDNPLWWDEEYAKASPWGHLIAPPYYIGSHTSGPYFKPEQGQMPTAAYLPGVMAVYAGTRWEWRRPVHAGERISATGELVDVQVSEAGHFGGKSVTHIDKLELVTDAGEVIAEIFDSRRRFERRETTARGAYLNRPLATYNAEDRARFERHYAGEAAALRRGAKPRFIEDVTVGETLGPMLKGPLTVSNIVSFMGAWGNPIGGANRLAYKQFQRHPTTKMINHVNGVIDEIGAVHWDSDLARAGGMPAAYDVGPQRFAWLTHLLTDWAGDDGFLQSLDVRFRKPNVVGDVTWIDGKVVNIDREKSLVTIQVQGTNQLQEVNVTGLALVHLKRRSS
jgi:acyl dehydratase